MIVDQQSTSLMINRSQWVLILPGAVLFSSPHLVNVPYQASLWDAQQLTYHKNISNSCVGLVHLKGHNDQKMCKRQLPEIRHNSYSSITRGLRFDSVNSSLLQHWTINCHFELRKDKKGKNYLKWVTSFYLTSILFMLFYKSKICFNYYF